MLTHINTVLHSKSEDEVKRALQFLDEARTLAIGTNSTLTVLTIQRVWQWEMTLQKAFMNHLESPGITERLEIISLHYPTSPVALELGRVYASALKSWREFQREIAITHSISKCCTVM